MSYKILNLYAGIGGNRRDWDGDIQVTAVEYDEEIAEVYADLYPQDTVIVGDAHEYLREHYHEYDFIWTSPPCVTHSALKRMGIKRGIFTPQYFDPTLWQEIIFLQHFADKQKWVVENVIPYYEPLILPSFKFGRHIFWANFKPKYRPQLSDRGLNDLTIASASTNVYGFDLTKYEIESKKKIKILRNLVDPAIGKCLLDAARGTEKNASDQISIFEVLE